MRPILGVVLELSALALLLAASAAVPPGLYFLVYTPLAAFASTYLIHCPAHYFTGSVLGIRFKSMRVGKTTLSRALPPRLAIVSRIFIVPTLVTDKTSLGSASRRSAAAMYASGTVASVSSPFAIATSLAFSAQGLPSIVALAVAIGYLLFDVVFSPKTGDLMRAKAALS